MEIGPIPAQPPPRDPALWTAAKALEASFLSEMLKSAGFAEARSGLGGGGQGEAQFASLLRDAHAEALTEAGGIGLAENLYRSLVARGTE